MRKFKISHIFQGSPPRMRGLLIIVIYISIFDGITPAHAGLTRCLVSSMVPTRDHPRACGAYSKEKNIQNMLQGSPPRMRGLLIQMIIGHAGDGITPAHAGLTSHLRDGR